MNASKENARKAYKLLEEQWWDSAPAGADCSGHDEAKKFIQDFFSSR